MPFSVRRHDTARQFLDRAEPWLLEREAEHNVILGLAARLLHPSDVYVFPPYLATVEDGDDVVGCALRTPPFKLIVTRMPSEAFPLLAQDAARAFDDVPALIGSEDTALGIATAWCSRGSKTPLIGKRQRIYQLERVVPARSRFNGRMRRATTADAALVRDWVIAFSVEANVETQSAETFARERIASGSVLLWEVAGVSVSMAAIVATTRHGARIGMVYTPPDIRGCGYASACVAALSQNVLDGGKRFCFLYTDLANSTSNAIYQRIGYAPVCDVVDCVIEPAQS